MLAIDPRAVNDSVYQKTLGINDFYLDDGHGGPPLGNIQLLGRVTGADPEIRHAPRSRNGRFRTSLSRRAVDWYAMSEDLPNPESRVTRRRRQIRLDWRRSNWAAHAGLVARLQGAARAAGYPIVLSQRLRPPHAVASMRDGADRS